MTTSKRITWTTARVQAYRGNSHTSNHVFRGTKGDVWEAGHHVPFFARWPGKIKSDSRSPETICLTDFFATAAEIVGAELPGMVAEDSFSLLPTFLGKARPSPRAPVIHHSSGGMFSIRDGKWKLVAGNGSGGREKPRGKPFERPYHLFDITKDISERTNVIDKNPRDRNAPGKNVAGDSIGREEPLACSWYSTMDFRSSICLLYHRITDPTRSKLGYDPAPLRG